MYANKTKTILEIQDSQGRMQTMTKDSNSIIKGHINLIEGSEGKMLAEATLENRMEN